MANLQEDLSGRTAHPWAYGPWGRPDRRGLSHAWTSSWPGNGRVGSDIAINTSPASPQYD